MSIQTVTLNDGTIVYDVYVNIVGPTGRAQKKKRYKTLREAKDGETLLKAELLLSRGRPERVTWKMWLDKVIETMRVTHRPSTVDNYYTTLGRWTPQLNDFFLDEITPADIHDAIYKPQGVQPGTRRTALDMLKRVFARAIEAGILQRNPAALIKVKVPQTVQGVLSSGEVERLLQEALIVNHRFYPVWAAALFTGMRSGELYALRWTDVDFDNRRICVTRAWQNKSGYGPTKNQRNRVVPISDSLMKLLRDLRLNGAAQVKGHEEFVLPHLAEWTQGMQAAVLRSFCQRVGITSIKFHDLRATFITQMLLKGVSVAQVMAIVGHTELKTTTAYLRVTGTDLTGTTDKLGYALPDKKFGELVQFLTTKEA